jgi:dimethylargininase
VIGVPELDSQPSTARPTKKALVRRPSPRLAEGLVSHIDRTPVDADLAAVQWRRYVDTLQEYGWQPVEVPPLDDSPDGVFIEDTMVVFRDLAVLGRSGAAVRREEVATAAATVAGQGYRIASIQSPGTLDGGDVLKVNNTVYVGSGGRTNEAGIEQLASALEPLGARVVTVPVSKVLHLKSAVTALPDGTVVGYPPLVDDPEVFPRFLEVPEDPGAHVLLLGEDRILLAASAPRTAELLAGMSYEAVVLDVSEFEKMEGSVTCLSVRLRPVA